MTASEADSLTIFGINDGIGFDMLAKNCMVDTLEQLDVTVHRAEKLESELSK